MVLTLLQRPSGDLSLQRVKTGGDAPIFKFLFLNRQVSRQQASMCLAPVTTSVCGSQCLGPELKQFLNPIFWEIPWPALMVGIGHQPSPGANTFVEVYISRKKSV